IVEWSTLGEAPEFIADIFITREQQPASARRNPARNTVARYFAVNLKDSRHRTGPRKSLRLLIAALLHLRAQYRIKQHSLQASPDLKHVFRIHQQRRVARHFRQARRVRSDHRSSVGHRFERLQPESLT